MTALTHFFFRERSLEPSSTTQTIVWWESRRPAFNLAVGAAGLVTLVTVNLLMALPPHGNIIPWQANVILPAARGVARALSQPAAAPCNEPTREAAGARAPAARGHGVVTGCPSSSCPSRSR